MKHWLLFALVCSNLIFIGYGRSGEKTVTIDDLMRLKIITGVSANPNGEGVVLCIQRYEGGDRFDRDLYMVIPNQKPMMLTYNAKGCGSFTWSEDGKYIAFTGSRGGKSGIFILPLTGGEPRLLLEAPIDIDNIRWKGDRIYFTAEVFLDCKHDLACTKEKLDKKGTSALVYEDFFVRQWNVWRDGRYQGLFYAEIEGEKANKINVIALGKYDVLPKIFGGVEDYTVGRDKSVIYTAKKIDSPSISTNDDLYEWVEGKDVQITHGEGSDRMPKISPDDKLLAYISQKTGGYESDRWRLMVRDRKTGKEFEVSSSIDNWVMDFEWLGEDLYVVLSEQGRRNLYKVSIKGKVGWKQIIKGGVVKNLSVGNNILYYTLESQTQPPDLYSFDPKSQKITRLTDLNGDEIKGWAMPSIEEAWYEVSDKNKRKVHVFFVKPKIRGKRLPLVVMIHGGPQGAFEDSFFLRWNPIPIASQGFIIAMPNITGSIGYGQRYVESVSKDWGGAPFKDIMGLLYYAQQLPDVDTERVCAMGGSYGGYLVNWIEGHSDRFRCLISHAGPSNLTSKYGSTDELWFPEWDIGETPWSNPKEYEKWSPLTYAKSFKTPLLIIHGANDFRVPVEQALEMFTAMKRQGLKVKMVIFPDEDHFVNKPLNRKFWFETVIQWLTEHLLK